MKPKAATPEALVPLAQAALDATIKKLERVTGETWRRGAVSVEPFSLGSTLGLAPGTHYVVELFWPGVSALLILTQDSALAMAKSFLFKNVEGGEDFLDRRSELIEQFGDHTVAEMGNILVHATANVWADAMDVGLLLSPPTPMFGDSAQIEPDLRQKLASRADAYEMAVSLSMTGERLATDCKLKFLLTRAFCEQLAGLRRR